MRNDANPSVTDPHVAQETDSLFNEIQLTGNIWVYAIGSAILIELSTNSCPYGSGVLFLGKGGFPSPFKVCCPAGKACKGSRGSACSSDVKSGDVSSWSLATLLAMLGLRRDIVAVVEPSLCPPWFKTTWRGRLRGGRSDTIVLAWQCSPWTKKI